jgi:hypothetical protein
LHQLTNTFPLRTTESMSRALSCAPNAPKTARNDYLKSYGLHDFKVCHNSFEGNNGTLNLLQHSCGILITPIRIARRVTTASITLMAAFGDVMYGPF